MHVVKNAAPTALAVMGLQLGYLLGGSILIETVFSWPGTGFCSTRAIFQRDLPLLQGTILVLALFFVFLNLAGRRAAGGDRPAHQARLSHERRVADRPRSPRRAVGGQGRAAIGRPSARAPRRATRSAIGLRAACIAADRCWRRSSRPISRLPIPIRAA